MNRIFKKTQYKLSSINQIVHVSIYCMSVQKKKVYLKRDVKRKKKHQPNKKPRVSLSWLVYRYENIQI